MGDCAALMKAIDAYLRKADDNLKDALEAAGFVEPEASVEEINALEEKLVEPLKAETGYMQAKMQQSVDLNAFAGDWPGIKAGDTADKELEQIFLDEFASQMPKLASSYIKRIDPELTVSEIGKRTTAWTKSWSAELGQMMKLTAHNEIERLLISHLDGGKSVADLTRAFMDSGIRDEQYRARRAALTEMLRAHSVAQQESITQSPAVSSKEWVHSGAYRNEPRSNHVALSGTVVPKDQPFTLYGTAGGVYYPMYPRDSSLPPGESVNCHCLHRGIADEKILGLSLEERRRLQQEAIDADDGAWEKELDAKNKAKAGIEEKPRDMSVNVPTTETPKLDRPSTIDGIMNSDVVSKFDDEHKALIRENLEKASDTNLRVVQKTINRAQINPNGDSSFYRPDSGYIEMSLSDNPAENIRTFWHEYGHYIDDVRCENGLKLTTINGPVGYTWEAQGISSRASSFHKYDTKAAIPDLQGFLDEMAPGKYTVGGESNAAITPKKQLSRSLC